MKTLLELEGSRTGSSHQGGGKKKAMFTLFEPVHLNLKQSIARFIPNICCY